MDEKKLGAFKKRLEGRLSASILVQKYLRPAAVKAGVIEHGQKVRFGFHNFRHSLASARTLPGIPLKVSDSRPS